MKSDLDSLMEERNLNAIMVMGDSAGNSAMNYLTSGIHLERALVVKCINGPLTLIHGSMERDAAATTGLKTIDRDQQYNHLTLLKKHEGDELAAEVDYLSQVIADCSLEGRLGIYGTQDAGAAFTLLNRLQSSLNSTEIVGEFGVESLFGVIRETKDNQELALLQEAGRLTCLIVGEVQAFIQSHHTRDEIVWRADDQPLTIGDVKAFMRERVHHYEMNEEGATIFSQGRDAGVPHNRGDEDAPLRLGQSIIFDIFPLTTQGYYHDMTRTWSLGYATDEVMEAWTQCKEIFDNVLQAMHVGRPCRDYQKMTCDYFESKGHPTPETHPGGHEGYVHSLGHGIGMDIHEEPRLTGRAGYHNILRPGHVVSVEPGLYYPDRGYGVRIEDSVAFDEDGKLINLTDYPYDLVIPMGK